MKRAALAIALGSILGAGVVLAQPPHPASPKARPNKGRVWASCVEHIPKGGQRPELRSEFPERGTSGYEARLVVTITHGLGETVLRSDTRERSYEAVQALKKAGFVIPHPDGGSLQKIVPHEDEQEGSTRITTLSLPFLTLPEDPGQHELELPPIPIAVSRANGEVMTLCTKPHLILIDDPIAEQTDPQVRPNPPPRAQREEWLFAKQMAWALLAVFALTSILTLLIMRYRARPKQVPEKPKILPWVAALARLEELKRSPLLADERHDEYVDSVSDVVREYLGSRYGFDGLECTTSEMRRMLKRVHPSPPQLDQIAEFLDDTDIVKFAKVSARHEDCEEVLGRANAIVRFTMPADASATPDPQRGANTSRKKGRAA